MYELDIVYIYMCTNIMLMLLIFENIDRKIQFFSIQERTINKKYLYYELNINVIFTIH